MSRAMLLTVGGSPEPLRKSIEEYSPDMVLFIVSQDSVMKLGDITENLSENPYSKSYIINDPNDLVEAYKKCKEAIEDSRDYSEFVIDYTGGTKSMSVGAAICGIDCGCSFAYVGGEERTEEGLGNVISGYEKVLKQKNPYDAFAIKERDRGIYLLDRNYFAGALKEFDDAMEKVQNPTEEDVISALKSIAEGYYSWDKFKDTYEGTKIQEKLANSKRKLDQIIKLTHYDFEEVPRRLGENLSFLQEKTSKKLTPEKVVDVYLNAERRGEEYKFDDGVARLYRLVELLAQYRLKENYKIKTWDVDLDKVPRDLREKYRAFGDENGKIKLGLERSYELLFDLEDELGNTYFNSEKLRQLLISRNSSILAHGFDPVNEKTYQDLKIQAYRLMEEYIPKTTHLVSRGRFVQFGSRGVS